MRSASSSESERAETSLTTELYVFRSRWPSLRPVRRVAELGWLGRSVEHDILAQITNQPGFAVSLDSGIGSGGRTTAGLRQSGRQTHISLQSTITSPDSITHEKIVARIGTESLELKSTARRMPSSTPKPPLLPISISLGASHKLFSWTLHTATQAFPSIAPHLWRFPIGLPVASGIFLATGYLFLPLRLQ